uniref:Dolichyl-diphosphooligosaccharide--protein glycosyltransferase subunit OST2 n=1 Tax=Hyaloperonospora arabidopsidis (strain Emoy2) TaxID=559515 RepID=M4B8W5_HYAAE
MAKSSMTKSGADVGSIVRDFCATYDKSTPKKLKLIDGFLAYVLATGVLQFLYCLLVGTFPFNSFLAGFVCTVGVFVLAGQPGQQLSGSHGTTCVCRLPLLQHHSLPRSVQLYGLKKNLFKREAGETLAKFGNERI